MTAIFGEGKFFGKLHRLHSLDTLWVENFDEIALSRTVKEIEANLCFAIFGKNSKIQNGRHFWGGENFWKIAKIFGKLQRLHSLDTLWVENFDEIALSRTVKEIEANLCFAIFGKNSKIQNGRHFWGGGNFWKIANITFLMPLFHQRIKPRSCLGPLIVGSLGKNGKKIDQWGGRQNRYEGLGLTTDRPQDAPGGPRLSPTGLGLRTD